MPHRKTVLVAGATGNVGGGAAVALAERGAHVVLLGRKTNTLEARADSIRANSPKPELRTWPSRPWSSISLIWTLCGLRPTMP